jgi:hypothetical protein
MGAAVAIHLVKVAWWTKLAYAIRRCEGIENAGSCSGRELHQDNAMIEFNLTAMRASQVASK